MDSNDKAKLRSRYNEASKATEPIIQRKSFDPSLAVQAISRHLTNAEAYAVNHPGIANAHYRLANKRFSQLVSNYQKNSMPFSPTFLGQAVNRIRTFEKDRKHSRVIGGSQI